MSKLNNLKLKEAIKSEGFIFENDVYQFLIDKKWTVTPNKNYFNNYTNKIQEYDMIAEKSITNNGYKLSLKLLIECKFLPRNVAFYERQLRNKLYPITYHFGKKISNFYDFEKMEIVIDKLKKYKKMFFSDSQIFGIKEFEVKKNNKKNEENDYYQGSEKEKIHDALRNLIAATSYEKNQLIKEKKDNEFHLLFPLLICNTATNVEMIRAHTGKRTQTTVEKTFRYKAAIKSDDSDEPIELYIYIQHYNEISKLLTFYTILFNKLKSDVFSNLNLFLKKTKDNPPHNRTIPIPFEK
ncbi:MAG: hypothetical protein Q8P20_02130 [bacterium]|nr:hypothetical protein [bacterium]